MSIFQSCKKDSSTASNTMNIIFSYGVNSKNILNTYECTYTKDMVIDPSITISLQLSESELDSIYEKMTQIDFFSYPDTFKIEVKDDFTGWITPYSTYKFHIEVNSIQKRLYWEDEITNQNYEADKLREIIFLIIEIIESKKEYQDLPPPRGGYN
jgi:hypothetical protein